MNDLPHGVVHRLGHALVASWLVLAPIAPVAIESPTRHAAAPLTPEIRPPTIDRATIGLARAPPANA